MVRNRGVMSRARDAQLLIRTEASSHETTGAPVDTLSETHEKPGARTTYLNSFQIPDSQRL